VPGIESAAALFAQGGSASHREDENIQVMETLERFAALYRSFLRERASL
jgi:hypothetical protein